VTLASHPPGESPKSANASHLLQNMSLNRVEDFFIADVGSKSPPDESAAHASMLKSKRAMRRQIANMHALRREWVKHF
jgi:hypothetical protein